DFTVYADLFVGESRKARDRMACMLDVPFGPTVDETLDIFPADDPNAPILVFIHGGYWRLLTSKEFSFAAMAPVARGYTAVVTNYSLCPKVSIEEITRQSRAALAWLYGTDLEFNGDRERIFVSGHSAGAQQTAMLLGTDWRREYGIATDIIKGGILISGLYDLRPLRYSFVQPKLLLNHDTIERQSPLFHLPKRAPAILVSAGDEESGEFRRQSRDYFDAWIGDGLKGKYLAQPGKNHFTAIDGFLDPESPLFSEIDRFMRG
ncbi:MAG TPA: alpha/beta hydrolase, partial [Gammaproteobacteria bacterium]|nr:alpha/beta hydrolase [Gammaproteobacteria bacterium]